MATLRPFRQVSEHDVLGLFGYSTADLTTATIATKGIVVKIESGWKATDELTLDSEIGASFGNVVSPRFVNPASTTYRRQQELSLASLSCRISR